MDDGKSFLEEQIDIATKKCERLEIALEQAQNDLTAFQAALEAYQRNSSTLFTSVNNTHENRKENEIGISDEITSHNVANEREELAGITPQIDNAPQLTKIGVLRVILSSTNRPLTVEEIIKRLPDSITFEITKNDLYKMLPRMVEKGEITRVSSGLYQSKNTLASEYQNPPTLFSNNSKEQEIKEFILSNATRNAIRNYNGKQFLAEEVFQTLKSIHPNQMDEKRRHSLSALLANLVDKEELKRVGKDGFKTIYQEVKLRST